MGAKGTIERGFERWGALVYRIRWAVILAMVLVALGLGSQLGRLETDTSPENYLHPDDPVRTSYDAFRDQFGRDTMIAIAIEPPEIFKLDFLRKLRSFHEALESEVPKIQAVTSLINIRNTRGERDELIVEDLLEEFPETPEELDAFRKRVLSNPLYRDLVISADETLTILAEANMRAYLPKKSRQVTGPSPEMRKASPTAFSSTAADSMALITSSM